MKEAYQRGEWWQKMSIKMHEDAGQFHNLCTFTLQTPHDPFIMTSHLIAIVVSVEIDRKHVLLSRADVVICSTPCKRKWWSAWKHLLHRFCWKKAAGKAAFFHEPNLWYSNCYLKRISNYAYLSRRLQIIFVGIFFGWFFARFVRILHRADVAQL